MFKLNRKITATIVVLAIFFPILTAAENSDEHASDASDASDKLVLFEHLFRAENVQEGKIAEDAIWQRWFNESPTAEVRASLDAGIERREAYDFEAAEHHFDKVVKSSPNYAEGYNQRAFIRFLRENYDNALTDLEIALKLEPNHFGALSGLYHVLLRQNKRDAALKMLTRAVEIHPWLNERSALPKEMWPEHYRNIHDPGQEI